MENRKMVAYVIEKMKIASGCVCSHIASGLGRLDEIGKECDEMACLDCKKKWLGILGDMVDEELIEATRSGIDASLGDALSSLADANGWPEMKESESATAYIERCFIMRPRYPDGEPVQWCDRDVAWNNEYHDDWLFNAVSVSGRPLATRMDGTYAAAKMTDDGFVERNLPEVLDADGVPIKVGDTVWLDEEHSRFAGSSGSEDGNEYSLCGIEQQEMLTVENIHLEVSGREYIRVDMFNAWCHASWLTHTPPDTQESINLDALLPTNHYWRCEDAPCDECPARVDGKNPAERYGTPEDCDLAMIFDLLRRQRELDKRKGGK